MILRRKCMKVDDEKKREKSPQLAIERKLDLLWTMEVNEILSHWDFIHVGDC